MFIEEEGEGEAQIETSTALRHLAIFQLKLAADAIRDFVLSPLSLVAFAIDMVRKPKSKDSLYLRLMLLGRRSDRFINLFDDHKDSGAFTIDSAVDELETAVARSRTQEGMPDDAETHSDTENASADESDYR